MFILSVAGVASADDNTFCTRDNLKSLANNYFAAIAAHDLAFFSASISHQHILNSPPSVLAGILLPGLRHFSRALYAYVTKVGFFKKNLYRRKKTVPSNVIRV